MINLSYGGHLGFRINTKKKKPTHFVKGHQLDITAKIEKKLFRGHNRKPL